MSKVKERHEAEAQRVRKYEDLFTAHNKKAKEVTPAAPLMDVLLPYKDYFINDGFNYEFKTKSQNRDKRLLELTRHVFAKYRVAPQLANVWTRKTDVNAPRFGQYRARSTIAEDFTLWYICVAQGGSLYKEHAKKYLTKKEVHTFLTCGHELSIEQSMVFATAMTFAPNEGTALRLARSKLSEQTFTDFLKTVIYFFAKNLPNSVDEVNDLTDFILARHREREENRPLFTMNGHTLDSLRKKCKDWHYELRRIKVMGTHSWAGAPLPDEIMETRSEHGTNVRWHFNQIKSSKALAAEGTHMRHCVYSYRDRCIRSEVYIWSLSREEYAGAISKKVTIELRNNGSIIQARGTANRIMKADERHVVNLWARKHDLQVNC